MACRLKYSFFLIILILNFLLVEAVYANGYCFDIFAEGTQRSRLPDVLPEDQRIRSAFEALAVSDYTTAGIIELLTVRANGTLYRPNINVVKLMASMLGFETSPVVLERDKLKDFFRRKANSRDIIFKPGEVTINREVFKSDAHRDNLLYLYFWLSGKPSSSLSLAQFILVSQNLKLISEDPARMSLHLERSLHEPVIQSFAKVLSTFSLYANVNSPRDHFLVSRYYLEKLSKEEVYKLTHHLLRALLNNYKFGDLLPYVHSFLVEVSRENISLADLFVDIVASRNYVSKNSVLPLLKAAEFILANAKEIKNYERLTEIVESNIEYDILFVVFKLAASESREGKIKYSELLKAYVSKNPEVDFRLIGRLLNEESLEFLKDFVDSYFSIELLNKEKQYSLFLETLVGAHKESFEENIRKILKEIDLPLNVETLKKLEDSFPNFFNEFFDMLIMDLVSGRSISKTGRYIFENRQELVEAKILKQLEHILESNAPPEGAENLGQTIARLPESKRADMVRQLLLRNVSSTEEVTALVSQLPANAENGRIISEILIREGIDLVNSNRSDFNYNQLQRMFGGDRFGLFFPWMHSPTMDGGMRTKFMIAIYIAGNSANNSSPRLRGAWVREKAHSEHVAISEGVVDALGYVPISNIVHFRNMINYLHGMDFEPASRYFRALIVQGFYEQQGYSNFSILNRDRGAMQVEDEAPIVAARLETSLREGGLSRQPGHVQRHMIEMWQLSSDGNLINNIRNRAEWIAARAEGFWSLRVEIHNFPTYSVLARLKSYKDNFRGNRETALEIDRLISEIESLLQVNTTSSASLRELLSSLELSDVSRSTLEEISSNFENASVTERLVILQKIRSEYYQIKMQSTSERPLTKRVSGDIALAQLVMVEAAKWIESFQKVETKQQIDELVNLTEVLIHHIRMSEQLTDRQVETHMLQLRSVQGNRNLSLEQMTTYIVEILISIINQVQFRYMEDFSIFDYRISKFVSFPEGVSRGPILFVDNALRSSPVFSLSQIVDKVQTSTIEARKISHNIQGRQIADPIEVFNHGEAVGILRLDKEPMSLTKDEIGVFSEVPAETAAIGGIVTMGVGARLSHLQLLAKSLGIPNLKISQNYRETMESLDGKWVHLVADKTGEVTLSEVSKDFKVQRKNTAQVVLPVPIHTVETPVSFADMKRHDYKFIAGPKGIQLAKLFNDPTMRKNVEDGLILPFGFFQRYARSIGILEWMNLLSETNLSNTQLVNLITNVITRKIHENPLPEEMISEVMEQMEALEGRTGHKLGYFFRSDTHIEDLPNFNGAGLNESVPNVRRQQADVDDAIRKVWISPFKEKSIFWRAMALNQSKVTISEPSVVIMPTVQAGSSGVIISRGGANWESGKGLLSANWGIGSVVEAGRPVEEISFATGEPIWFSYTVTNKKPEASDDHGIRLVDVEPGTSVLNRSQAKELNAMAQKVESILGNEKHGWDIEWAIDQSGNIIILQARPNM